MLECVVNISAAEVATVSAIADCGGDALLDVHTDAGHNRSVLTLVADEPELWPAVCAVTRRAVHLLDLRCHEGAHPRIGVVDVVPWVDLDDPWAPATPRSLRLRDRFAAWVTDELGVPSVLYGPERSLPSLRRSMNTLAGHPTAGAIAVGARGVLIAYNLWLSRDAGLLEARRIATAVRRPGLRTLGLQVGPDVQVSCNLTEPAHLGPADAYDLVNAEGPIARAELVGLLPRAILDKIPGPRWAALDVGIERTIEARAAAARRSALDP